MTPARILATALLCSLAVACGDSGPGEDGELPAAFTVMATREAGVTDPCSAPMGDDQDFTIVDADTDAPELRTTGLSVRACAYGSTDSGWLIECNTPDGHPAPEEWSFVISESGGGRVTWRGYTMGGTLLCDDAFTIDGIQAVTQ